MMVSPPSQRADPKVGRNPLTKASKGAGLIALFWVTFICGAQRAEGEVILQYFNTGWGEIASKMPEIAEAGYSALWLPPPSKASGGLSVGYDLWDPFDLGGVEQRGTIRTKYGTEGELLHLVEVAHRFGIRVYFDNIMNHRAFDIPGYDENTPVDIYPGMLPEDFHLRKTEDGFYRKWDNTRNWQDQWQVQNLGLADLVDISHESPNTNFGENEGGTHPKLSFVRDAARPWQYDRLPDGRYVGFGRSNGITREIVEANPAFYKEDVNAYLIRAVRWFVDRTKADGLRLDAVKHVPSYFFGKQAGWDKDGSNDGYLGGVQWQFNVTRGFSDWSSHRDSVFNHEQGRDDAMVFGEHLGSPPGFGEYIEAGMRLVDAPLHRQLNSRLGNPGVGLAGLDQPGWSGDVAFSDSTGVPFAQSHDDDVANRRELQHAYYLTKRALPNIYTDGYYKAGILGESGGAFPRHANNPFLGQFGDPKLPNLLTINEAFARGDQIPRWSDGDIVAYERRDKRENPNMADSDATVMLFMMNDNYSSGLARPIQTSFPANDGGSNAYLHNYSPYGGGFFVWASQIAQGRVVVPPGGYFAFSWKNPDPSPQWPGRAMMIFDNGEEAERMTVTRRDGPDGDPLFNPYGLPNRGYPQGVEPEPFSYQIDVPIIRDGRNIRFVLAADGSAENVQFKLGGGVDVNSQMGLGPLNGELRDHPPAVTTDTFLGYEQARFVRRTHAEKFAATDTTRCKVGSRGAETYYRRGGALGVNRGSEGANNYGTDGGRVASWVYHDPGVMVGGRNGLTQFDSSSTNPVLWAKSNGLGAGFRLFVYYTTNGDWPEGAAGVGIGSTKATELKFSHKEGAEDWWRSDELVDFTGDIVYKIGAVKDREWGADVSSVWPGWSGDIERKLSMLTLFEISGFNAKEAKYRPHNDYGEIRVGLPDGWHVLRGRAYLKRWGGTGRHASIYRTFTQPFYLDTETPKGSIKFPEKDGDQVGGQGYDFVVRTDLTVTDVWYHIEDGDSANDDGTTRAWKGNGVGGEPFTDNNRNGGRDGGEPYIDINENGSYDVDIGESWSRATRVSALADDGGLPAEWRFGYTQIPSGGNARVRVRLVEASSLKRAEWKNNTSDEAGNFSTLERNVKTRGPEDRFFIAWPSGDGDIVGPGYVLKIHFSPRLRDGLSDKELLERFTIRLQNSESGRLTGGVAQNREDYKVGFEGGFQTVALEVPNMYNGQPSWLHGVSATFRPSGGGVVSSGRLVKAAEVPPPPVVEIVQPQEIDSDGKRLEIALPDLARPSAIDREVEVVVRTGGPVEDVTLGLSFDFAPGDFNGNIALKESTPSDPNPREEGGSVFHRFRWSGVAEGQYRLRASISVGGQSNSATRNATVVFRQEVEFDLTGDSDDDGIPDTVEAEKVSLPGRVNETWTNGDVHLHIISGRTDGRRPQSDGGGLPDGLELGLGGPISPNATDLTVDTNGDGFPNFLPDLDPPIFNTFNNAGYEQRLSRTDQIGGSVTDPSKPDTDDDGLEDHEEDINRNGRVDIGILGVGGKVTSIIKHPNIPTTRNSSSVNRVALPAAARLLETDPNNRDTDGDGLIDGQEDMNGNGRVDIFLLQADGTRIPVIYTDRSNQYFRYNLIANSDSVILADGGLTQAIRSRSVDYDALFGDYNATGTGRLQIGGWPKLLVTETDPIVADTIRDGFRDGWKAQYGLDPLDNGGYNFRTGGAGDPDNLPSADLTGDGVTNAQHYLAGTDPRSTLNPGVPGGGSRITIGPGSVIGVINGVSHFEEFSDWNYDDLVALDEYEGDGGNNQGGDIFPAFDQWDSSRDIVAFYARDGGDSRAGGDDRVYFRIDFDDLRPFAESGHLDLYVAINHTPGTGERVLPDEIDTLTDMRWRALVAVYSGNSGRVYVDTNISANTSNFGDSLSEGRGVVEYGQGHPSGFKGAYFNSELDAVEFSISRKALLDSGWLGADFKQLNFQVFATKDGTGNNPRGGGDIAGRSDVRDSVYDDRIAEDNFFSQAGREDILKGWFSKATPPAKGQRAKLMFVLEESQPMRNGEWVRERIRNSRGGGYHRAILAHDVFEAPVALAISPLLASSIQWAGGGGDEEVSTGDGPSFNQSITRLGKAGELELLTVTFGGHALPYSTLDYDRDNIELSNLWLEGIYDLIPSPETIYLGERTANHEVFSRLGALGFRYTFADRREHIEGWFGRTEALGANGYRINRANGINLFVIADDLSNSRFANLDKGVVTQVRRTLSRKARSGEQQQATVLLSSLSEFSDAGSAGRYDLNLRWYANRPWVEIVRPRDVAERGWTVVERGGSPRDLRSKDFVQYATLGSYDNWYYGVEGLREGLYGKRFEVRPGVMVPSSFGRIGEGGVSEQTWRMVSEISIDHPAGRLGRAVTGAGLFSTAFHNQGNVDLRKFSNGQYINQPRNMETMTDLAAQSQAGFRHGAIYARVMQWAVGPNSPSLKVAVAEDVDLDGEAEYILYNNRIMAIFERLGGRMTGAWLRDPSSGKLWQVAGNHLAYSGFADEREGSSNSEGGRTSGFKDWFFQTEEGGSGNMVNSLHSVTSVEGGFQFETPRVRKRVTIPDGDRGKIQARYILGGTKDLYVRFGLSPNLEDLLLNGQANLGEEVRGGESRVEVVSDNGEDRIRAYVEGSQFATHNRFADFLGGVVGKRDQPQVHQVEFLLSGEGEEHILTLGFEDLAEEQQKNPFEEYMDSFYPGVADSGIVGLEADPDGDGMTNFEEFLWGSSPRDKNHQHPGGISYHLDPQGVKFHVEFQTLLGRVYLVESTEDLQAWKAVPGGALSGDGTRRSVTDDITGIARRFYRVKVDLIAQ